MAIDDPIDAYEKQNPHEKESVLKEVAALGGKLAFPGAALLIDIAKILSDRSSSTARNERAYETFSLVARELRYLEKTKLNKEDLAEAVQELINSDIVDFNDAKRARYINLIGNAAKSEAQIDGVTTFIQTIEQLNEQDLAVLKVLNRVMNKPGDWEGRGHAGPGPLHPNTFIDRRQELGVQVAEALKQSLKDDKLHGWQGQFSREDGYSICARLQGFGLAHEVQVAQRQVPIGDYSFRPSKRGLLLLKLIGEDVPNFNMFFPQP